MAEFVFQRFVHALRTSTTTCNIASPLQVTSSLTGHNLRSALRGIDNPAQRCIYVDSKRDLLINLGQLRFKTSSVDSQRC